MKIFFGKKLRKIGRVSIIFVLILGWIFSGWPQIGNFPPKIERVYATDTNILPNAQSGDTTGESISEITGDDSVANPDTLSSVNAGDNTYTVDKGLTMYLSSFDTSGIGGGDTISGAVLHLQYGAEDGYCPSCGGYSVRYDNGSGLTNTSITPTDISGWSADLTYDLYTQGVDTLSELAALDVEFYNNDGKGPQAVHFDYLWITVTHTNTAPNAPTQNNPSNGLTDVSITPTFTMTATDPDSNDLSYKVTIYAPAVSSKTLDALGDGVWYFHVQLRNQNGWGGVSHFRFQIDTKDPEYFNMEQVKETDLSNPTRSFFFDAEDATSGIGHYTIQIDDSEAIEWRDDGEHTYTTPVLGPGKHTIIVNAMDKAGNFLTNVDDFIIDPLRPCVIEDYPSELTNKDPFIVRGTCYPNSQVVLWLQREATEPQSFIFKTDEAGKFVFVAEEKLREGIYQMWAEVIDERGARSEATEKFKILVQPTKLWRWGTLTANVLSIIIPLVALLILFVLMIWLSWHKVRVLRKRVNREAGEAQVVLHKEFNLLKRRISKHIVLLEKTGKKRKLTKEEEKMVVQFKKDLDYVEEKVQKEIKDIQKEVK